MLHAIDLSEAVQSMLGIVYVLDSTENVPNFVRGAPLLEDVFTAEYG
ncbi:MAG: hypothetical protein KTR25_03405 [Myxococcales bacterium]|nr:hypothetical protein [Myxococcales bacterium]